MFRTPTQSINPTAFALRGGDEKATQRYERLVERRWMKARVSLRSFELEIVPANDATKAAVEDLYNVAVRCMTAATADL